MKYGLQETQIDQIQAVLARYPEVEKALLFGSRAVAAEIAYRKQKAHGKYIKRTNKMITECAVCGSKFVKRRNPSRYCSERCHSARTYVANCRKNGKSDDYMLKSKSNYKKEIMMLLEREQQKGCKLI